ncbi:hypothetical protein KIN20_035152 [Parelaphostrongylus tenuis]|uniref:Uncharacterized protein n=1 Tax=Parelaphostrongylus tenuis TaxID=148309 RepID=A0AAD5RAR7_PARTN|nr:hypothetical protein KIN20_035152 [Parelaphostrongylus tenuis]
MPLVPCLLCSPAGNTNGDNGEVREVASECTTSAVATTDETARIEENAETSTAKIVLNGDQTAHEEGSDEITNVQSSSNSYEQGDGIRQHLIDAHAKFVANAFLYPDLSSSIHYWLMACVEYGTPPNDPMINQICSATTTDQLIATSRTSRWLDVQYYGKLTANWRHDVLSHDVHDGRVSSSCQTAADQPNNAGENRCCCC